MQTTDQAVNRIYCLVFLCLQGLIIFIVAGNLLHTIVNFYYTDKHGVSLLLSLSELLVFFVQPFTPYELNKGGGC